MAFALQGKPKLNWRTTKRDVNEAKPLNCVPWITNAGREHVYPVQKTPSPREHLSQSSYKSRRQDTSKRQAIKNEQHLPLMVLKRISLAFYSRENIKVKRTFGVDSQLLEYVISDYHENAWF